jgi:glycerol-1-phosphate dehydrogenase [NAD(P)+]
MPLQMPVTGKVGDVLAGTYRDPETGNSVGVTTRVIEISPSLAGAEAPLIETLDLGRKFAVVSDTATHAVLGERIEKALVGKFETISIVLPDRPHPDDHTVELLRKAAAKADALIAVGSGTINDLCKFAAAQDGKPYAVFATAPSMNGYTSVNAAITIRGHKLSLPAQAPIGAFFDLRILSEAPARLIRAGLGDSLCRCTAQADWLLSHMIFRTEYRELPFHLLSDDEKPLFDNARALMAGDLEAMKRLVNTLVLAGFGTAIVGHSQPASQGEHLISHFIDMFEPSGRPPVFHGEQVGVTTLSMARLQELMLRQRPEVLPDTETEGDFERRYGKEIGRSCWAEFAKKQITSKKAERINDFLAARWSEIVDRIQSVILPSAYLESVLRSAGAETAPEGIHLHRNFYRQAVHRCREIRNRFTFLDLAAGARKLEALSAGL